LTLVNGMWQLKQSKLKKKRKSDDTGKILLFLLLTIKSRTH